MPLDAFGSTIHRIYAAAADPALWTDALRAVEELTGAAGAVLGFTPTDPARQGFVLSGRFAEEQCMTYARDYAPICRRIAFGLQHPEIPFHYDSLVLSEAEMDRDPVYDWLQRENGVRWMLVST